MADPAQGASSLQWLQVIIGGGIAGALASLASTRIEWRRLQNEEQQKSAYFEQELFRARLGAYQTLAMRLSEFTEELRVAMEPVRESGTWTQDDRKALDRSFEIKRAELTRLVVETSLLFGPAMDEPLDAWTAAVNLIVDRAAVDAAGIDPDALGPEEAFRWAVASHWGIVQAMRADLHLKSLDSKLVQKLSQSS